MKMRYQARMSMGVLISAICMAGFLIWSAPLLADPSEAASPIAVLSQTSHDFGTVLEGTVVVHDFSIRNVGNAPLSVTDIKTG